MVLQEPDLNKMNLQIRFQESFVPNTHLLIPVSLGSGLRDIIRKCADWICSVRDFPGNEVCFESFQIDPKTWPVRVYWCV